MASAPSTKDPVAALFRQFDHDLKRCNDNDKKANIQACIAYLKSEGIKAVPKDRDHVLFAHKGVAKCMTEAAFTKLFTDPKIKANYINTKNKNYCVGYPFIDQKMAGSNKDDVPNKRSGNTTSSTSSSSNLPERSKKPGTQPITRTQFQSSSSRASSPARSENSSTHSLPPVPADQKLQVAEYILKEKGLAGMHLISAKVRLPVKYGGSGDDDDAARLDICYDTGSTVQVLHINNHWKFIGGDKYTPTLTSQRFEGAGGIVFYRELVMVELRVFKDDEQKVPLTDWFECDALLGGEDETLLSGFEMVAKQGLIFACVSNNAKLLVAHESHKLALAWKVWTS